MLYCEKCMLLCEDRCPNCSNRLFRINEPKLREVRENDPVFVTEQDRINAGIFESVLKDENIPYLKEGTLGAGMTVSIGDMLETYKFYVPYGVYDRTVELAEELFSETEADEADGTDETEETAEADEETNDTEETGDDK